MEVGYTNELHDKGAERTIDSARVIVPFLHDLIRPRSVVDVGCGHGYWLREFINSGSSEVLGIDGDYITEDELVFPVDRFVAWDLNQPLSIERTYDLAISIEVAEHLEPSASDHFIESLCRLSNCILFSAAIPGQLGHRHINANWPQFWAGKFQNQGYVGFDFIRPKIWHMEDILLCHRQNMVMYVHQSIATSSPWNTLPRINCLTLVDVDTIAHLLSPRESAKRLFRKLIR